MGLISGMFMGIALMAGWREIISYRGRKRFAKAADIILLSSLNMDDAASIVGSGVGLVGTGIGTGLGLVGSGLGAGAGIVGSGFRAVGSGFTKAGKCMGRTIDGSKRSGSTTPVNSIQENGGAKPLQT